MGSKAFASAPFKKADLDGLLRKFIGLTPNYFKGKILNMGGIAFAVGGASEHIHVCLMIPPHISVSTLLEN
jgi:hypothetical protein